MNEPNKMIHSQPSPLAGKTVRIKDIAGDYLAGAEYEVEDWWDRVAGQTWKQGWVCDGNLACLDFAVRCGARAGSGGLPLDDEVLYGKVGGLGKLVHITDIDPNPQEQA